MDGAMMQDKLFLPCSDDEEEDSHKDKLKINKSYAKHHEEKHRRNELRIKKAMLEASSEESEDEEGIALNPVLDLEIMKTISLIRAKDERIYKSDFNAFKESSEDEKRQTMKTKIEKKRTYKDLVREEALAILNNEKQIKTELHEKNISYKAETYATEQGKLKDAFKKAGATVESDSEDELFAPKVKSIQELQKEEGEFQEYLKGLQKEHQTGEIAQSDLATLEQTFSKPADNAEDEFLRKYVLQRKWIRSCEYDSSKSMDEESDVEEVEKADKFEAKYNFRFEEEGADEIKTFPRQIESSLRKKNEKRKRQRQEKRKRDVELKQAQLEELKRLKNLKKKELQERVKRASEAAGCISKFMPVSAEELDEEFDPEKHDKLMEQVFNEQYYQEEDKEFEEMRRVKAEDFDESDNLNGFSTLEPTSDEEAKDLNRDRAPLPDEDMDKLYELDYEGFAGGMKTRFRYRKVKPESYGLTTDEIVNIDDRLLNEFVSRKRFATYQEHEWYVTSKQRRRFRQKVRESLSGRSKGQKLVKGNQIINEDTARVSPRAIREEIPDVKQDYRKINTGDSSSNIELNCKNHGDHSEMLNSTEIKKSSKKDGQNIETIESSQPKSTVKKRKRRKRRKRKKSECS